jgi:septal ring factor EnvC (AmiA/AmiB activator)
MDATTRQAFLSYGDADKQVREAERMQTNAAASILTFAQGNGLRCFVIGRTVYIVNGNYESLTTFALSLFMDNGESIVDWQSHVAQLTASVNALTNDRDRLQGEVDALRKQMSTTASQVSDAVAGLPSLPKTGTPVPSDHFLRNDIRKVG